METSIIEKNGGKIILDPSTVLNSNPEGYHVGMPFPTTLLADRPDALLEIGADCRIHGAYIHATKHITIGKGVLIAAGTTIVDANGHTASIEYARYRRFIQDTPQEIVIGDYVWIGMNCIILKGVHIGEGAIISAGAVVKTDVTAFAVVEGNPAQVVKQYDSAAALAEGLSKDDLASVPGFYVY